MVSQKKARKLWGPPLLPALTWLLIWLTSCGGEPTLTPSPIPSPTPTPSPQVLLNDSAAKMAALNSLAFTLTHERGSTPLMTGVVMNELEGQVDLPNQFAVDVKAEATAFRAFIKIDIVAANQKVYMTDPLSGRWQEISLDILPFNFSDLGNTLAGIMTSMDGPALGVGETIGGRRTLKLQGTITSKDLSSLVPKAAEDLDVGLDVWVEEDRLFLVRARIAGPVVNSDPPDVVRVLTFSAFNEPVTIKPPI